jgi:hypothetical protein
MAYIGNTPAENYASFLTETFTVSATTNYTLSHAVTNENEIRLVINGVVQQPGSGKAYTASGTTLTLSSATASGDVMYAVYLGRALQTVNPPNASVGNSQTAPTIITGQTAETSIATDDTILIHDTSASALRKMTRANFVSGIGGTNTPAFAAYLNTSQSFSTGANTKINMTTEDWDTDGAYDAANSKFTIPSGAAGKYRFLMGVRAGNTHTARMIVKLYKNGGTQFIQAENRWSIGSGTTFISVNLAADIDCSVGDYFEPYVYMENNAGLHGVSSERHTFWSASKLIGV